ncbi:uncharacterized protein TrAFT101_008707 [Trichoderma asperellum]|uniref:uncharacterized protein n=1 Tax=Trichoderma asperellum TaxID=101201 RepID=UPI00332C368C|nr:hypothetical protein TrAFT101_008707 [Trichoderma asperellum]
MLRGSLAGLKSLKSQSQQFQKFPSWPSANLSQARKTRSSSATCNHTPLDLEKAVKLQWNKMWNSDRSSNSWRPRFEPNAGGVPE